MSGDIGVDIAVFESEVASFGGAVYESKSFTVAKGLSSLDMTVYKSEIFRVPAEIFALHHAVPDGDIFPVPESVLRIEDAAVKDGVPHVLEPVFPGEFRPGEGELFAAEEEVLPFRGEILSGDAAAHPAELGTLRGGAAELYVRAFPERLDAAEAGILDADIFRIPQRRPAELRHLRAAERDALPVPEGIAEIPETVLRRDVPARFQGALPVGGPVETAPPEKQLPLSVKGALFVKSFVFYDGHCVSFLSASVRASSHRSQSRQSMRRSAAWSSSSAFSRRRRKRSRSFRPPGQRRISSSVQPASARPRRNIRSSMGSLLSHTAYRRERFIANT